MFKKKKVYGHEFQGKKKTEVHKINRFMNTADMLISSISL